MTESEMNEWLANLKQEQKKRHDALIAKFKAIAKICKKHGVLGIAVNYSGSGDSGCTDNIWVVPEIKPVDELDVRDADETKMAILEKIKVPAAIDKHSSDNLLSYTGELLADMAPDGWENNDGGEGTALLDCETGEVTVRHGSFYTEVNYETYSINDNPLIDPEENKE